MKLLYQYKKSFLAFPLALLMNIQCLKRAEIGSLEGDFNYFFLLSLFDTQRQNNDSHTRLVFSFMSMGFVLIFAIWCGMDIYKELFSSGIYVIIRVTNKVKWIYSLIRQLIIKVFLFSGLYVFVTLILQQYYTQMPMNYLTVPAILLSILFLFLVIYSIALLINYLSIVYNTSIGCFVGVALLVVMILCSLFYYDIPLFRDFPCLRYFNLLNIIDLFYETNYNQIVFFLCYYAVLFVVSIVIFARCVVKLDIKIVKEDI